MKRGSVRAFRIHVFFALPLHYLCRVRSDPEFVCKQRGTQFSTHCVLVCVWGTCASLQTVQVHCCMAASSALLCYPHILPVLLFLCGWLWEISVTQASQQNPLKLQIHEAFDCFPKHFGWKHKSLNRSREHLCMVTLIKVEDKADDLDPIK